MVARHAWLALFATVACAGCHAGGFRAPTTRPEPIALKPQAPEAREVVARWNANARRVASLEAHPSITVASGATRAVVKGDMALERPRNFRLTLARPFTGTEEADLGSNEAEFWFWSSQNNRERAIYVCEYDASGATPLAVAMQPDWIVEAMGLREIEAAEAAGITSKVEGTNLLLTSRRRDSRGSVILKETLVEAATGRIKEHRLVAFDPKGRRVPLATASISKVQQIRPEATAEGEEVESPVYLPRSIRLVWHEQKFQMDVQLDEVKVNPQFDETQRAMLFTEPKKKNYARRNLAGNASLAGNTTIRETRPAPPTRSGSTAPGRVRLDDPIPIGVDGASPAEADPRPLEEGDLPPLSSTRSTAAPLSKTIIGARVPTAPEGFGSEVNTIR